MSLYHTAKCGHSAIIGSRCETCFWANVKRQMTRMKNERNRLREKLKVATEALEFGVNVMMAEIHNQRTLWPGEVDDFEDKARSALTKIKGEK